MKRASIALVVAEGGDIVVQASSPGHGSEQGSPAGFRVGASHEASTWTGTAPASPGGPKLPPIVWSHADLGQIMRQDLAGVGKAVVVGLIGMALFIAAGVGIAFVVAAVLSGVGIDPSSSY